MPNITALVIGGTGVTGGAIVAGLLERRLSVTVLHSGRHKPSRAMAPWYYDGRVRVLLSSPDDPEELRAALVAADGSAFHYDHVFVLYGRLRYTCAVFVNHCERFYAATGAVIYDTWGNSTRPNAYSGMMLAPLTEETPIMTTDGSLRGSPNSFNPKLSKIVEGQQAVFKHFPDATIVQYGKIYGPYNLLPQLWSVVKRVLDDRPGIIVSPHANYAGPWFTACYSANAAQYFLLAMSTDKSKGQVFAAVQDKVFSVKQMIRVVAKELRRPDFKIFELPTEIAIPARPLDHPGFVDDQPNPGGHLGHWSNEKAHVLLGYKDVVDPMDGLRRTARWLARPENEPSRRVVASVLHEPFAYELEDELLRRWERRDWHGCLALEWGPRPPGWGHFWYGPGANPGDPFKGDLKKKYAGTYNRDSGRREDEEDEEADGNSSRTGRRRARL